MKELEFKDLVKKSEKLAKVNDLWYVIVSACGAWVAGTNCGR